MGKSTLALEIAHRFLDNHDALSSEERFDAIIWASAKERILTADGIQPRYQTHRTLDDLYTAIAITLQREDIPKATIEQQAAMLHSALIQRRTLIIVDNLETIDDEAVINFIRELPAPTKVIVTTRHRIDVAYAVRLAGMPLEDAQSLIGQECQNRDVVLDSEQIRRLYDRTGGVPLAIVWSVAQMGYGYPVETVLARLGSADNDIIRFCFAQALVQIEGQPAEKLLLALSYFAGKASREALGQVAELSILDRDEGLVGLEKLSLVNKKGHRFSLLPVTRLFAEKIAIKNEREYIQCGTRWLRYLEKQYSAEREYSADFRLKFGFYQSPEDVWNLVDALDWAHQYGDAADIFSMTIIAGSYLDSNGQWEKLYNYTYKAFELARNINNINVISRLSHSLGILHEQWGDFEKAKEYYQNAVQGYSDVGDQESVAAVLQKFSAIYRKLKDFDSALQLLDESWDIISDMPNGDVEALINTERGKYYRDLGEWHRSEVYFNKVKDYFETQAADTVIDVGLAAGTWGHLAVLVYNQGRPQEAKELCLRSIEYFREHGSKGYMATLEYRLALAEEALGDIPTAKLHVDEALHWFKRLGMKPDIPEAEALQKRLIELI